MPMDKSIFYRAAALIWIALIYATTPLVPSIQRSLVSHYGYSVYNYLYIVFIFFGCIAFFLILKQHAKQRLLSFLGLMIIFALYGMILPRLNYGVEKIHFLEYGFLAFLLVGSFQKYWQDILLFVWILILIFLISLGDEAIQSLIPNRVAEISDVWLNVLAGGLGFFAVMVFIPSFRPINIFNIVSFKKILASLIVTVISVSLFLCFIHGFGYKIKDPQVGSFYSSFQQEDLLKLNESLKSKAEVSPSLLKAYENEGYRHAFQRDFYDTNKFCIEPGKYYTDWRKSHNENRILEKYYSAYLDYKGIRWEEGYNRGEEKESIGWQSRVKSTIITSFILRQMMVVAGSATLLLSFLILLLKKKGSLKITPFSS